MNKVYLLAGAAALALTATNAWADPAANPAAHDAASVLGNESVPVTLSLDVVKPKNLGKTDDLYLGRIAFPDGTYQSSIAIDSTGTTSVTGTGIYVLNNGHPAVITGVSACNEIDFPTTIQNPGYKYGNVNMSTDVEAGDSMTFSLNCAAGEEANTVLIYGGMSGDSSGSKYAMPAGNYSLSFTVTAVY